MRRLRLLLVLLLTLPGNVLAQINPHLIPTTAQQEAGVIGDCRFVDGSFHFHCLPLYLGYLIQLVFSFLGTICIIMIIWSGYEWVFAGAGGDNQKAKARLTNALLGLAFAVLSYLIVDTIVSVLFSGPQAPVT